MDTVQCNGTPAILVTHGNKNKKHIALTYDTGFVDSETVDILDALRKHGVKCTFFTTGIWAKKFPVLLNRIVSEGHEIANHSLDHPDMTKISYAEMVNTVVEAEKIIKDVTGIKTTLFRTPYGTWNKEVLRAIGEAGYRYGIYWSVDTLDWMLPPVQSIVNRIVGNLNNGDIVLMHIGGNNTAKATDKAIINLKARQYEVVTVSAILE